MDVVGKIARKLWKHENSDLITARSHSLCRRGCTACCTGKYRPGARLDGTGLHTHTDGEFIWKINNGRGAMPLFEGELANNDNWNVINYIRRQAD